MVVPSGSRQTLDWLPAASLRVSRLPPRLMQYREAGFARPTGLGLCAFSCDAHALMAVVSTTAAAVLSKKIDWEFMTIKPNL
ncbi:hypothetical protein PAMC26577_37200 [Caballeronia sordidicola]|uniref:Uncharacterized protein n=1 Tax=Caballeronia sordidicola TaxID=196367 RepID=A0A2C9XUT7_CABSO|nr:hypothetical protein PAMC26577_37200 [Caballeronia sordidicola]